MKLVNTGMFTSLFHDDTNLFGAESKIKKCFKKLAGDKAAMLQNLRQILKTTYDSEAFRFLVEK
jgi:hypothetical protein